MLTFFCEFFSYLISMKLQVCFKICLKIKFKSAVCICRNVRNMTNSTSYNKHIDYSVMGINAHMKSTTLLHPNIDTDYLFSVFFFPSQYLHFFWNEVKCPSF